ncbi:hypothetical protein EP331_00215 [bacterium]|nr:MAG: hypothetical protein EP331_00215 [bacterium]
MKEVKINPFGLYTEQEVCEAFVKIVTKSIDTGASIDLETMSIDSVKDMIIEHVNAGLEYLRNERSKG